MNPQQPQIPADDDKDAYALSYAVLNRAYNDDEPEYTETDLIWKNPNFVATGLNPWQREAKP